MGAPPPGGQGLTPKLTHHLATVSSCLSLLVCSSTLVVLNKHVISIFPYPILVGALGMVVASVVCFVYCTVLRRVPRVPEVTFTYW